MKQDLQRRDRRFTLMRVSQTIVLLLAAISSCAYSLTPLSVIEARGIHILQVESFSASPVVDKQFGNELRNFTLQVRIVSSVCGELERGRKISIADTQARPSGPLARRYEFGSAASKWATRCYREEFYDYPIGHEFFVISFEHAGAEGIMKPSWVVEYNEVTHADILATRAGRVELLKSADSECTGLRVLALMRELRHDATVAENNEVVPAIRAALRNCRKWDLVTVTRSISDEVYVPDIQELKGGQPSPVKAVAKICLIEAFIQCATRLPESEVNGTAMDSIWKRHRTGRGQITEADIQAFGLVGDDDAAKTVKKLLLPE